MNNTGIISKIELLPNEILLECFKYLNGFEILYSFNQLNYRLNQLIRSIPLYMDFRNIHRSFFKQFCDQILSNQIVKNQIYSLILSNESTYNQFELFVSLFSFDGFSQLQSLALTTVLSCDRSKLKIVLPLISKLRSLKIFDISDEKEKILSIFPSFQSPDSILPSYSKLIDPFTSLTNLTIPKCSISSLCQLLASIPSLIYLQVETVDIHVQYQSSYIHSKDSFPNLKYLIIKEYKGNYDRIEMMLERTPNLRNLTIYMNNDNIYAWDDQYLIINVDQLENLITVSLPYLKIFKFIIQCDYIELIFKKFQSDFWCKQHNWFTECSIFDTYGIIYTIPYMFDEYHLKSHATIYSNTSVNHLETFQNVTDLSINIDVLTEKPQCHFPHVKSLTLKSSCNWSNKSVMTKIHLEHFNMIMNISNLKHLDITNCIFETSTILFELLKNASQLSSVNIQPSILKSLYDDEKLSIYLNNMITKLQVTGTHRDAIDNSCDINKFYKVFTNIEQLICVLDQLDEFLFLLKHLPKLTYINVFSFRFTCHRIDWLEELHLDEKIIIAYDHHHSKHLEIWFAKKKHE